MIGNYVAAGCIVLVAIAAVVTIGVLTYPGYSMAQSKKPRRPLAWTRVGTVVVRGGYVWEVRAPEWGILELRDTKYWHLRGPVMKA